MARPCPTDPLPCSGVYRVDKVAGPAGVPNAVAVAVLRTPVGALHLRLPVLSAALVVGTALDDSWLEIDLDGRSVTSSTPPPLRRAVDARLGQALETVRLETFALADSGNGRLRAYADLYAAGRTSEVAVDLRVVENRDHSVRLAVDARFPRPALGLGNGGGLAGRTVRLVAALHATALPAEPPVTAPSRAGAAA